MGRREISNKNLMWSVAALVLVLLLIPAALGGLSAMNDAIAAEYVTTYDGQEAYYSFAPFTSGDGAGYKASVLLEGLNTSNVWWHTDVGSDVFYDTNGSVDTLFVPAAQPVTSTALYYNLNFSAEDLYNSSTSMFYVYYSTSQSDVSNLTLRLYSVEYDTTDTVAQAVSLVTAKTLKLTNGTYLGYLDITAASLLKVMSADNGYNASHLSVCLSYVDSNDEFVEGEQIDFQFTFEGQRGVSESAMTPYIVGGLGGLLLVSAVAATDVVDPLASRNKIHLWKRKSSHRRRKRRW